MERRSPTGWPLFIVTALAAAGVALGAARPAHAQDDAYLDPPPPPSDDGAQYASPRETEPPPQPPDEQTFDQGLSAYGHWVDTPEYGRVWIPDGTRPDWQPYTDGQWVDTTYGWAFVSAVPWGWATFHYGRWGYGLTLGWFWVPGFVWGPAWVGWRVYPGYACWSPMPPHGFVFHGHWPGWVVMNQQHFTRPIARFVVPRAQATSIARAASPVRGFASARAGAWSGGRGAGRSRVGTPGGGHGSNGSPAGGRGAGGARSGGHTGSNIRPGTARTSNSRTWAARPGGGSRPWAARPGGGGSRSWSARPGIAFRGNGGIRGGGSFGGGFHGGFHMGGGGFRGGRR